MAIRLELEVADLAAALRPFKKLPKAKLGKFGDALFGFQAGVLRIEAAGIAGSAAAEGEWPGEARVPAAFLVGLARWVPSSGRAELYVQDGKLSFRTGSLSMDKECRWETSERSSIQLPMHPTLRHLAQIAMSYTTDEIERAGATAPVTEAKEKAEALIAKAS